VPGTEPEGDRRIVAARRGDGRFGRAACAGRGFVVSSGVGRDGRVPGRRLTHFSRRDRAGVPVAGAGSRRLAGVSARLEGELAALAGAADPAAH